MKKPKAKKRKTKIRIMRKLIAYARVIIDDGLFFIPSLCKSHTLKEPAGDPNQPLFRVTLTEIRKKPRANKKSK